MPKVCGVTCFVIAACRAASCTASTDDLWRNRLISAQPFSVPENT